jgi:arylsulfatase A-like enzyme
VTLCSLRQDFVSAYGPTAAYGAVAGLTPTLDQLAENGQRFHRAYAASPFTLASLTAILTGRFPSTTGVVGWDKGLTKSVPTLPEILGLYGYRTGGFTIDAASGFRPDYGLDRGIQHLEISPAPLETPDGRRAGVAPTQSGASAVPAARWLVEQPTEQPLFLMFHSRTAHYPFLISDQDLDADPTGIRRLLWDSAGGTPVGGQAMPGMAGGTQVQGVVDSGPDPLLAAMAAGGAAATESWRRAYGEAVQRADLDVAVILDAVQRRGRPTLWVLVADHGESLNDHGEMLHGDAYFDSVVRVPLIVTGQGVKPGANDSLVSHVDLLPTILDMVGVPGPAGIDGVSARSLLEGGDAPVRTTAFVEGGVARKNLTAVRGAVISPPWVLIRQDRLCAEGGASHMPPPGEPQTCLFGQSDPQQLQDVSLDHPQVVKRLLSTWNGFRSARAGQVVPDALRLDPAFVELLQNSGYDFHPEPE